MMVSRVKSAAIRSTFAKRRNSAALHISQPRTNAAGGDLAGGNRAVRGALHLRVGVVLQPLVEGRHAAGGQSEVPTKSSVSLPGFDGGRAARSSRPSS
jgi:hypothetical protein